MPLTDSKMQYSREENSDLPLVGYEKEIYYEILPPSQTVTAARYN